MFDTVRLGLLVADFAILLFLTVQPLSRRFDDSDRGSGAVVHLPPLRKQAAYRAWLFVLVSALVSIPIVAMPQYSLSVAYRGWVDSLLDWLTRNPDASLLYADRLIPLLPTALTGYLITFAIVLPATFGRRVMILLHAPLFLLTSVIVDTFIGLVVVNTGITMSPTPVVNMFVQYSLVYVLLFRLAFTTYQLPRTTHVPLGHHGGLLDSVVTLVCLVVSAIVLCALVLWVLPGLGDHPVYTFIIVYCLRSAILDGFYCLLGLYKWSGNRPPKPDGRTPLVNVIIPAYNESAVIERLLRSIDRAAGNYGGPVHVVMCDDGSTDDTRILAEAVIATYRYATGTVVQGSHGGKSKALNTALSYCTADYVYRVDADCALDADAFVYSVPHFVNDPLIGVLGAYTTPKEPYSTWIDRMRLYEQVLAFGFTRVVLSAVDAVPCIPGTFCAFRREAAIAVGGFVSGMLGEDADFTCAITRLGYRAVVEPRVKSYEDVPATLKQLRVQRWRWTIGGLLTFARFTPFGTGWSQGPRVWFKMPQTASTRITTPAHIFAWTLALVFAAFQPSISHQWLHVVIIVVIAQLLSMVPRALVMIYYKRARDLLWFWMWVPFSLIKAFVVLEAMMCVTPRPVKPPIRIRARYPTWTALIAAALLLVGGCSAGGHNTSSAPASGGAGTGTSAGSGVGQGVLVPQLSQACDPGVNAAEFWIFNASELTEVESADPSTTAYGLKSSNIFVLKAPGQTSAVGQTVAYFKSYAAFQRAVANGTISPDVHWVAYDNEDWAATPVAEQENPVQYETMFAQLAHQNGYKVILMPALDLVHGSAQGAEPGQAYLDEGLATASAKNADIYEIQAQSFELSAYRSTNAYAAFVSRAVAQARAANPDIVVFAGISTQRAQGATQLDQDYLATRSLVAGYWLNVPQSGDVGSSASMAGQFLKQLPNAADSAARTCAAG